MKNFIKWVFRLRANGVVKALFGFLGFLVLAAVVMFFIESGEKGSGIDSLFHSLWFSIVTVTTVGYGDMSPLSQAGKAAAIVIMMIGIVYIGVLTASITSWLVERNRKKALGLVAIKNKTDHFIIIGWKKGMTNLLKNILDLHGQDSRQLVLINTATPQDINKLKQDPVLKDVNFFNGDGTNREILLNACCDKASKVLVLADEISNKTPEEIDFQTVLATIAVKRINPSVYIITEILQPKFALYLQHVEVEEIILNRLSARALMCNISLMSGMSNVFREFFDMRNGIVKIKPIQREMIGKTYQELNMEFDSSTVIGLLENTGNLRVNKAEKMNQLQKAVSIEKAIQGLMELKSMMSNTPVFYPTPTYIIKENSSAIVLDVTPGPLRGRAKSEGMNVIDKDVVLTTDELIRNQIVKALKKAKNGDYFVDMLKRVNIEIYQYRNQVSGVIFNNKKIPFETLGLAENEITELNQLLGKKRGVKEIISTKLYETLSIVDNWEHYYKKLSEEKISIYLYRDRASGVIFGERKYSFKVLGIDQALAREINKHKHLFSTEGGDSQTIIIDSRYRSLKDFLDEKSRERSTIRPLSSIPKVLMILGWKSQLPEMIAFLIHQYDNHNPSWEKIVVVATISKREMSEFSTRFKDDSTIEIHSGDYLDRDVLKNAGIARATKVIILAETDSGKSFEEIDAQTVLAAMLISSMNKRAYKVAEILDKRYKESLEQINVEEIFMEDEFNRIMLANGSNGLGITKVIRKLINLDETLLEICSISEDNVGISFENLLENERYPGKLIIGLLEETGNIYARKSEKIRQAQIQSDIEGQVDELIRVKELEPNRVIIVPKASYEINANSKLIVLNSSVKDQWELY